MKPIHEVLLPIQKRLWLASILRGVVTGFLVGIGIALCIAVVRMFAFPSMHWSVPVLISGAAALAGMFFGVTQWRDKQTAARLVDDHYDLKDRSITSLQFAAENDADALRGLQMAEAQSHLQKVDPVACVPIHASSRQLQLAGGLSFVTLAALMLGNWMAPTVEAKSILPLAQQQSQELREEMLPELEELAKEQDDEELDELVKELQEKVEEMEEQTMDEADLLANLSEMEQALAEARDALQMEMTEATMKALAAAMKPSDAMQQAAKAIEAQEYDEASEKLKAIDPSKIGDKQRRAVADNLKKMLAKLKPGQQGELSENIGQLVEGLENKNQSQCKKCLAKLAGQCKKQGNCKKIGNCMLCQLNRLAQCKSQCRGQCNSNKVVKTNSPSTKAGKASSGQPLGDKATKLDATRKEEHLSGVQGAGPSETEILQAPEGEQEAIRQFAKKYNKFKREAESVLDSEPLPMGHRETVRAYFEAIRPSNETSTE